MVLVSFIHLKMQLMGAKLIFLIQTNWTAHSKYESKIRPDIILLQ